MTVYLQGEAARRGSKRSMPLPVLPSEPDVWRATLHDDRIRDRRGLAVLGAPARRYAGLPATVPAARRAALLVTGRAGAQLGLGLVVRDVA